jgi:hypothetical protein
MFLLRSRALSPRASAPIPPASKGTRHNSTRLAGRSLTEPGARTRIETLFFLGRKPSLKAHPWRSKGKQSWPLICAKKLIRKPVLRRPHSFEGTLKSPEKRSSGAQSFRAKHYGGQDTALKVVESLKTRGVKLSTWAGDIAGNGMSKLFLTIAAAFAEAELREN